MKLNAAPRTAGLDNPTMRTAQPALAVEASPRPREQTRSRYPDQTGYVERDGVRVFHEVYGDDEPTALLLPTWSIVHSRFWKFQIAYLAHHLWLTDFVGWLPMPEGGTHEAALTADYNAEMLEQIARHGRVRDRSIFIGEPDDIVPETFGPGLPQIRAWTEEHYRFAGYVTDSDPVIDGDRAAWRAELGYRPDAKVCIVTVGGSGVGRPLLRHAIEACPDARRLVPELQMVVVAGPRIDSTTLAHDERAVEIRSYVPDLHRHLAACDLAIVHSGLATGMELTVHQRPFLYFPLARHFEQNLHVDYRLRRHGAGRRMEFDQASPTAIAAAVAEEIGRQTNYLPVATDGAAPAAAVIAEVL